MSGEKENIGNGVADCPHCDGPFFKGRDVAVIGGGGFAPRVNCRRENPPASATAGIVKH